MESPDVLTSEEKKDLDDMKQETRDGENQEDTCRAFANQLTKVKEEMKQNRTVVTNLFKEVEEFHEA